MYSSKISSKCTRTDRNAICQYFASFRLRQFLNEPSLLVQDFRFFHPWFQSLDVAVMMNIFSHFISNVRIDQICIKRIPKYSTFPSTFGLWCHCGQILTSILSGWLTYCMTDNCSSLQRQTSTVYEFSKEEASLTVRKVKPFVTAALATSSVCTVKQPGSRGDEHLSKRLWFFGIFP